MNKTTIKLGLGLATAVAAGLSANAAAVILGAPAAPPVGWTPTGALVASLSSGAIADDLGSFTAELHSAVYSGDASNPFGGLTFAYKMDNIDAATADNELAVLAIRYVKDPNVAVEQSDELSNEAALAQAVQSPSFTSVNFFFIGDTVEVSSSSSWLVIHSSQKSYTRGKAGISDGTTEDFPALIPVPEPSVYAGLFALGLAGFAAYRRFSA